jgi:hypothetical protein
MARVPSLRLLTVNARTLPLDRAGLAALIEDAQPHVACVHGAPSLLRWRSISAALARQAGMVVVGGGRTGGGNLVLSTLGVDVTATRDLSFAGTRGPRPAGATFSALALLGHEFVFAGARLDGAAGRRRAQAGELQAALDELVLDDRPAIVCAEGADRPGTSSWDALAEGRTALADGIFVDERITVDEVEESNGRVQVDLTLA